MKSRLFLPLSILILFIISVPGCAVHAKGISRLGYSIQVGAFSEVKNAERLTVRLQEKGIEAFYFRKENGVYAVRFGDFSRKEEARATANRLVKERLIGDFFIASPITGTLKTAQEAFPAPKVKEPARPLEPLPRKRGGSEGDMGGVAARTAERFVGIPYRWGGNNVVEGMDCSGFVRAVYNLCGVNIPRTSGEQFQTGRQVERDDLRDGDLVFFGNGDGRINHVGIYVGDGRFVHAPRRGDDIKISGVGESYFDKRFMGARRYFD